jgi:hypothetical protein
MSVLTESKSNSIVANYDGDKINIIAEKNSGDGKHIYITQLSNDDIKNMIAQRSNEKPLEERLKSDYKCRYNFRRPTIQQHRGYAKRLLNSLKDMDMVMPSRKIKNPFTRRKKPVPKESRRRKNRKRRITRGSKSKSVRNRPKTIRYTPYPITSKRGNNRSQYGENTINSDDENKIPINQLSEKLPDTISKLIANASRSDNIN